MRKILNRNMKPPLQFQLYHRKIQVERDLRMSLAQTSAQNRDSFEVRSS